ncbi:MAG: alpha-glucosidase C-terminal domain-containing protein [Lentisphaeria bacterium]|nr:alpha-glucosidase C-terminal domain-containing protein [Lentisphaeria bacterium]
MKTATESITTAVQEKIELRALPQFARGATMYQIFLRQFTSRGTLQAAQEMIPYLAGLGIKIVYLCPIVEADDDPDQTHWSERQRLSGLGNPKNPYRISDYFKIDPEYGTDEDLASFVNEAHQYDIRVMLDLVYFHCGPHAKLISMEPEYVVRDENGEPVTGEWHFPLLNFKSEKLREYLYCNMLYFVEKFDIDGYRCDVGGSIPLDFWEEGRRRIDRIKSEFLMLNEHKGSREQQHLAFDLGYGFRTWGLLKVMAGEWTAGEYRSKCEGNDPDLRSINHSDNHDWACDAFEKRNERILPPGLMDLSLAFIFSFDGMPLLYNGQEIADDNRHSLWANYEYGNHLGIDWRKALTLRGQERMALVKKLVRLRKELDILEDGKCRYPATDHDEAVFACLRETDKQKMLCIFNFRAEKLQVHVDGLSFGKTEYILQNGVNVNGDAISMEPYSYAWVFLN